MPKPSAPRVKAHRARKREQGLVEYRAWVTPEDRELLRDYLTQINKNNVTKGAFKVD